jgi:antirestriction protein ArdC
MREFAKRVSAMTADDRRALADRIGLRTIEGHALSVFNACMVYMQKNPPATVVGGFRQWLTAGRCVRKGEHGFAIWVPIGRENGNRESSEPTGDDKRDSLRFTLGTVFDVSQTDPVEVGAQT